jgi:hypothetical protein
MYITSIENKTSLNALITHEINNEVKSISFQISHFGKKNFKVEAEVNIFEFLNKYWESLSYEEQTQIFYVYLNIHDLFTATISTADLDHQLKLAVKQLIDVHHNLERLQEWIAFDHKAIAITVPPDVKSQYEHSIDRNTSPDKTYLKTDYTKLISLSLCLRCMVPVWGDYISMIRSHTGNEFKEKSAYELLLYSSIVHSEPVKKLLAYIEHIVAADIFKPDQILDLIPSEDYPHHLLCFICVKRLSIADFSGRTPESHLVKLLYKFLMQKTGGADQDFGNGVREKKFDEQGSADEVRNSALERYRLNASISLGDIEFISHVIKDPYQSARKISTLVNFENLTRSLNTIQEFNTLNETGRKKSITIAQVTLLQWIFDPIIKSSSASYLNRDDIIKCLAVLSTCYPMENSGEFFVSGTDSRNRLSKENEEKLNQIYCFSQYAVSKKGNLETSNRIFDTIDKIADALSNASWRATIHEDCLREVFGNISRKISIKPDIKNELAKLIIEIGENSGI